VSLSYPEETMPKSKVRKKNDFAVSTVSRTPVKVKVGPSSVWFVALFVGLMLIGLVWLMVFQLAAVGTQAPTALHWMAELGPWNYAIAFAFMITGLLLTMRWH
jgi:Cell division protein CrgA